MSPLWPIALITFKEGTRNRAFYGISLIAFLMMGAAFFISGMVMRDVGKVAVDMALSTVSFAGLLLVLFVGIDLMAKDLDKRTIYMVLARPISRQQYIVGKFLGISLLIATTVYRFEPVRSNIDFFGQMGESGLFPSILLGAGAAGRCIYCYISHSAVLVELPVCIVCIHVFYYPDSDHNLIHHRSFHEHGEVARGKPAGRGNHRLSCYGETGADSLLSFPESFSL